MRKTATEIVVGVVLLSPGRGSEPNQHEAPLHTAILLSRTDGCKTRSGSHPPQRSGLFVFRSYIVSPPPHPPLDGTFSPHEDKSNTHTTL